MISLIIKDILESVVAVGNSCRVLRTIDERDMEYYYKDLEIEMEL
jgi:galactoside O-acetyltransferase